MRLANPPRIRELMDDEVFRTYMKTMPPTTITYAREEHPIPGFAMPGAWAIWVRTTEGRWRTAKFNTYPEVWAVFRKYLPYPDVEDIAIVSRRVFLPPPGEWYKVKVRNTTTNTVRVEERWRPTFAWDDAYYGWCARCRRPSTFRPLTSAHHALRGRPCITDDDPDRCVYCGIRRVAMPADPSKLAEWF